MFFLPASRRGRPVRPADAGGLAKGAASSWEDLQLFTWLMWRLVTRIGDFVLGFFFPAKILSCFFRLSKTFM